MSSYQNYKNKALQNPEVKKEYDALQPEYEKALKDLNNKPGVHSPSSTK